MTNLCGHYGGQPGDECGCQEGNTTIAPPVDVLVKKFNSGSTRSSEPLEDPEGFLSPFVIDRYNDYMARNRTQSDGNVRNSDNWQKGMPKARYMRAMWRHFLEAWRIWRCDGVDLSLLLDPLCAIMFNVHGMLLEVLITIHEVKRPAIRSEEDVPKQR